MLLAFVAYQKYSEYQTLQSIDSYEACIAAKGSIIQESYPAVCVDALGAKFTQYLPPISSTLKDYSSNSLGFSIQLPENTRINISSEPDVVTLTLPDYKDSSIADLVGVTIIIQEVHAPKISDSKLYATQASKIDLDNLKQINPDVILGISEVTEYQNKMYRYTIKTSIGDRSTMYARNSSGKLFRIYDQVYDPTNVGYFLARDQILSTFKFLDAEPTL